MAAAATLAERVDAARIRAPTRGNRRLEQLLEAVNADQQVKAWWHVAGVNAERLGMSDHSWVHIQVVTNIALRLARLLFRRGVVPATLSDHESYSLFLTADKLNGLLAGVYPEPERSVVVAEAMHGVISHRSSGKPLTIEGAIVRVADALDMAKGRSRVEFEAGRLDIHSISAYAIDEVRISAGEDKAIRVEIEMSNSAGIFQVDEGLGAKLRGTPLAEHIEVIARIEGEHEKRLVPVFRL